MIGKFATVAAFVGLAVAAPFNAVIDLSSNGISSNSFDQFNNFFGVNNFLGIQNDINVLAQLQCSQVENVVLVQQQLAILQEVAKQIVLTELCNVQDQLIALQQFQGGIDAFQALLVAGQQASFDQQVALLAQNLLVNQQLNQIDFGFSGVNIGQNAIVVLGNDFSQNNLIDINNAFSAAYAARVAALQTVAQITTDLADGNDADLENLLLNGTINVNDLSGLDVNGLLNGLNLNNGLNNVNINGLNLNNGLNNVNVNGLDNNNNLNDILNGLNNNNNNLNNNNNNNLNNNNLNGVDCNAVLANAGIQV